AEAEQRRAVANMHRANTTAIELLTLRHREGPPKDTDARFVLRSYLKTVMQQCREMVADRGPPDPVVRREGGRAYHVLGMCHSLREEEAEAEAGFGQAREVQARLAAEVPDDLHCRIDLAMTWYSLSELEARRGRRAEAEAAVEQAVALTETLPADELRVA